MPYNAIRAFEDLKDDNRTGKAIYYLLYACRQLVTGFLNRYIYLSNAAQCKINLLSGIIINTNRSVENYV